MWQAEGYKNQRLFLDNALNSKKYSHAYLFAGPERENKKLIAREFAQKIIGQNSASKFNPDLISVDQDKLKIEDIRNLISELSLKPYQSEYKVAIIDNFESITEEGANSILKTLEEPNPSTIIILLVRNPKLILPTIISRCQSLYFNSAGEYAAVGNSKELSDLAKKTVAERFVAIKDYAEKETAELNEIFENWLLAEQRNFLAGHPEKYPNLQSLTESIHGLKQNLNKKLILERLFLNLV